MIVSWLQFLKVWSLRESQYGSSCVDDDISYLGRYSMPPGRGQDRVNSSQECQRLRVGEYGEAETLSREFVQCADDLVLILRRYGPWLPELRQF